MTEYHNNLLHKAVYDFKAKLRVSSCFDENLINRINIALPKVQAGVNKNGVGYIS